MTFPVYLHLGSLVLHPHVVLEGLGYFIGARLYFAARRRESTDAPLPVETNLWLLVGCVFGAWAGSKLLAWVESPSVYFAAPFVATRLIGGKTIAGGLLGGWAGVELAKRALGLRRSTGDAFVWPLAVGTALGRMGCFLTGLSDHTYGVATTLPWGVDFGDGVPRHPTQLYEAVLVLGWAGLLATSKAKLRPSGTRFRWYLLGYFAWRFAIEFLKPRETWLPHLSAIQLASLTGVGFAAFGLRRLARAPASA